MKKILLLDTGIGNIQSVANVLEHLGASFLISDDVTELRTADKIIFPGVGTYGNAVERITRKGLYEPIRGALLKEKKLCLGICVGMQVFSEFGHEFGNHKGLGVIPGVVKKIDTSGEKLQLPHVGWNDVEHSGTSALFKDIPQGTSFYFLHSFHFVPTDERRVSSRVRYGGNVVAAIESENVFGVQFHPEKSQGPGIQLIRNFVEL